MISARRAVHLALRGGSPIAPDLREPERRPGRGHDDVGRERDLQAAGGGQPVDRGLEADGHLAVHRVAGPGAVQRDDADAVGGGVQDPVRESEWRT